MKRFLRTTVACACCLSAGIAIAQEGPAVDTSSGRVESSSQSRDGQTAGAPTQGNAATGADAAQQPAQPAVDTGDSGDSAAGGTSVIGDAESPIGLYIIPWRSTSPTPQLDRPARFVDATEEPVDETQFRRFVEYHEALSRHRAAQRSAADGSGQ